MRARRAMSVSKGWIVKIVVIGGAGFIGSHVVDRLVAEGNEVHVVDTLVTGRRENVHPEAKFHGFDACDPRLADLFRAERFDAVNFQAFSDAGFHATDPPADVRNNLVAFVCTLEAMRAIPVRKLVYISSGGIVYGDCGSAGTARHEASNFDVRQPIISLKVACESYLKHYAGKFGYDYTVLRYSNVYGPRQRAFAGKPVVPVLVKAMLSGERPVLLDGGTQTRDFIYVKDVARANFLALTSGSGQTFNIASGVATSVRDLHDRIAALLGVASDPEVRPREADEIHANLMDITKAQNVLGFTPDYALEDGLRETVEHYRVDGVR